MTIEDILNEWEKDADISRDDLTEESLKISKLHAKYYRMFVKAKMKLISLKEEKKSLILDKNDYYRGIMPAEEIKKRGWDIWNLTILKTELPMYIEADKHIQDMNLKIALASEKCDLIESIIKTLNNRGFHIKTAVDFERFRAGN